MTKSSSSSGLGMRRNCNLELRLSPSSHSAVSNHPSTTADDSPQCQQLTIFYNGKICVCDVTEFQAKAILMLATKEMEEKSMKSEKGSEPCSPLDQQSGTVVGVDAGTGTGTVQSKTPTAAGLSMKKSLQRFLQKRNHRVQATSPYPYPSSRSLNIDN